MLEAFDKRLEKVVVALSWMSCAIIPCMFTMIVIDVSIRTFGYSPPLFTSSVVEYGLLYMTMLAAPWLVRQHGHVAIEALVAALPNSVREPLAKGVYLVCGSVSMLFVYFTFQLFWQGWQTGELDVRGIDMPYWSQFLPMPIAFFLVGLEFFMYLAGLRHYYSYDLGEVKDGV